MGKQNTNFIEILLRKELIGATIYDKDDNPIIIDELNYDPKIQQVYIKSGNDSYKFGIDENYDFDFDNIFNDLIPIKTFITGKRYR